MPLLAETTRQRLITARAMGFRPDRTKGQNFLVADEYVVQALRAARITDQDTVIEVGAGLGALTCPLVRQARKVIAFEPERELRTLLLSIIGPDNPKLELIPKIYEPKLLEEVFKRTNSPRAIVTNLPYQISSQFVISLVDLVEYWRVAVVMLQREVAQRITTGPGSKVFSVLSITTQVYCHAEIVCTVTPEAFIPEPKVSSALLYLSPRQEPMVPEAAIDHPLASQFRKLLYKVVKSAFTERRRTLSNTLSNALAPLNPEQIRDAVLAQGVDLNTRAEALPVPFYAKLTSNLLEQMLKK